MERETIGKPLYGNPSFLIALSLIVFTVILMISVYTRFLQIHILIGPFYIHHWLSWIGSLFISFFTPIYFVAKRRFPSKFKKILQVHVFGNLFAAMFISIHFTQHISRSPQSYPDLGTGIVLYASVLLLVVTGFFLRYQIGRSLRKGWIFLHTGATTAFYLVIVVHILHGLAII